MFMENKKQNFEEWKQRWVYTLRTNEHVFNGYKYNSKEIVSIYDKWQRDKP